LARTGRNEPCPCGSGKRYKECHGSLARPEGITSPTAGDIDRLMRDARQLQRDGRLAEAAFAYQRVLEIAPRNVDALTQLGVIFFLRAEHSRALELFQSTVALEPNNAACHNNCGEVCRAQGRDTAALEHYDRAIALAPAFFEAWLNRGLVLRKLGKFAEAETSLRNAMAIAPERHAAPLNLGHILRDLGRPVEAVDQYRAALGLAGDDFEALSELAITLGQLGMNAEAAVHLERLQNLDAPSVYILDKFLPDAASRGDGDKELLIEAARRLPPERMAERSLVAQYLRTNLRDSHSASRAVEMDADNGVPGPNRIRIETASACNLRCQHCPTGVNYDATDRTAMKMDLFELILAQMKTIPTLRECVLYLGGEPLMNKNLVKMCQRVKQETTVRRTIITTNAMLLNERWCAALATAGLDNISVSIDGRSPEENDAIRLRSHYRTIVDNVAMLRSHLKGTTTQITLSHCMFRVPGDPDVPVTPDFIKRDFPGIPVQTEYATRWPGFDIGKCEIDDSSLSVSEPRNFCDFPFFDVGVRANGDVVLCCHDLLAESVMGNVKQNSLLDIWNGPAYRELRRHMLNRDAAKVHKVCQKCFVFTGERIHRGGEKAPEAVPVVWS
jgi:radical SAM protein with 4Fe4S-binding SPASM domain